MTRQVIYSKILLEILILLLLRMIALKIRFLGTGTSHGVPVLGCTCKTCKSSDQRNTRYRSAVYIEKDDKSFLIDTPQELRLQLLEYGIIKMNAVLYTHPHADHILGFDDLRSINKISGESVNCYGNDFTINEIRRVFQYVFTPVQIGGGLPQVTLNVIRDPFNIAGVDIIPLPVKHGKLDILGYRIDDFAYITDCSYIPEDTMKLLQGVKYLVLGALRYRKHTTHMTIDEALTIIKKLKPMQAYLTHLSHEIEYNTTQEILPSGIYLAYDGLKLELEEEK